MDPHRKRAIRLTVALTAALLLASALIFESFSAGEDELTASQLLRDARPGVQYILAGSALPGYKRTIDSLDFKVVDPKLKNVTVAVHYTGEVPDAFGAYRGVLVTVQKGPSNTFVGENGSLTTKCPSKYQTAPPANYKPSAPAAAAY
jgi:cytochrome c-type biogenesis protein CcmE